MFLTGYDVSISRSKKFPVWPRRIPRLPDPGKECPNLGKLPLPAPEGRFNPTFSHGAAFVEQG